MFRIHCLAVALLLCFAAPLARANSIITSAGTGLTQTAIGNTTAGFDFTVGSDSLLLTALGMWDQSANGFTNSHTVDLWDNAGNLLATVQIAAGTVDPLTGTFRYVTLATPILLQAGMTYVLGASYIDHDADRLIANLSTQASFDPAVTAGNFRQTIGAGVLFPTVIQAGSAVGPNALFTAVPEAGPGTALIGAVFGGLFLIARRRPVRP
jgi:hypothetical protein